MESVIRAPGDLRLEQFLEKVVIEIPIFADLRAAIDFQTTLAEPLVPKPLIHRRAEALLFPVNQIVVDIRFGGLFEDFLADSVRQLVRVGQPATPPAFAALLQKWSRSVPM